MALKPLRKILLIALALAGIRPPALAQRAAQPAWSHFVQSSPRLQTHLATQYDIHMDWPSHAAAFDRLMLKTGSTPPSWLGAPRAGTFAKNLQQALSPVADHILDETQRLKDIQPSEETLGNLERLAPEMQDLSLMASLLPAQKVRIIVSQHWLRATLIQAKVDSAIKKDAAFQEIVRSLSSDMDSLQGKGALSALSRPLIAHHHTISALEAADATQTHSHVIAVLQKHEASGLYKWLDFLSGRISVPKVAAIHSAVPRPAGVFSLLNDLMAYMRSDWSAQELYAFANILKPGSLGTALRKPDPGHVSLLQWILAGHEGPSAATTWRPLKAFFQTIKRMLSTNEQARIPQGPAAASSWKPLEAFFQTLNITASRDRLRDAIQLLWLRVNGRIPDPLWQRLLQQPPKSKQDRISLSQTLSIWAAHPTPADFEETMKSHAGLETLDYQALHTDTVASLSKDLARALKLTRREREQLLGNVAFVQALRENELLDNILSLLSFTKRKGLPSVKRLILELSRSLAADGTFRYMERYKELHGKVPKDILKRWMENYVQPWGKPEAEPQPLDWGSFKEKIQASLGVSKPDDVLKFSDRVHGAADRLKGQYKDDAMLPLLRILKEDFLPSLKSILESLEGNRAPPAEALQTAMAILGKSQWLKGVVPNAQETLGLVRTILKDSTARKKTAQEPPPDLELLHVTDDPARMIAMGEVPEPACQTCKRPMTYNLAGEPVNKLLLGQIKLANWMRGGEVIARCILEIGEDDFGRPALFVESLKKKSGDANRMKESILEYAKYLDVSTVYIGDRNWEVWKIEKTPLRQYRLFDQQGLPLRRDSIGDDAFGFNDASDGSRAIDLKPPPPGARPILKKLSRWAKAWRILVSPVRRIW